MKSVLFWSVLALSILGGTRQADAQKTKDQEYRHVIVTLTSGEKVEGYVKRGWHAESSHFKKSNYSFKMTPTPDAKETLKYTADDVQSIDYTEKYEDNPDGIRWEAHQLALPSIANRYNTVRRLMCVEKVGENATVYWWKAWDVTTDGRGTRRTLRTYYGIRFHDEGEEGDIVYTYMLVNSVLLKDKKPGLKEYYKNWFKGVEGKEHKKEAKTDVAWILDMYDAYLKSLAG
ncbi:hypothetical protein [Odoribacter lunatus]|uniref:hypothetical protein n=1 Tax=Odoribacter lunatus TaxID=2941335 RepID=UPI00203E1556|nr:hypothetical protein [Odoribacter lunatus]